MKKISNRLGHNIYKHIHNRIHANIYANKISKNSYISIRRQTDKLNRQNICQENIPKKIY